MNSSKILWALLILLSLSCNGQTTDHWTKSKEIVETIGNIFFICPDHGFAFDNRNELVAKCLAAIKDDIAILKIASFTDTFTVRFLDSRAEMKKYTNTTAGGTANIFPQKICYFVVNKEEGGLPIKHELMHLILMSNWSYPVQTSLWMNEGLAAFAENNCNGYTDEQIYRFLSAKKMLISMDSLTSHFYMEPEMIAYHQCGYLAGYLLNKYGIDKFQSLWTQGFENFEKIYGIPFSKVQEDVEKKAIQDILKVPNIDWSSFEKGCS